MKVHWGEYIKDLTNFIFSNKVRRLIKAIALLFVLSNFDYRTIVQGKSESDNFKQNKAVASLVELVVFSLVDSLTTFGLVSNLLELLRSRVL